MLVIAGREVGKIQVPTTLLGAGHFKPSRDCEKKPAEQGRSQKLVDIGKTCARSPSILKVEKKESRKFDW